MLDLPQDFIAKYTKLLGAPKSAELIAALNELPKKAFRINSLKQPENVVYDTSKPVAGIANAFFGQVNGQDPEWVSGTVYSQDPAAMFPAQIAGVKPGEKVLDLCAAPGGKSTALGEQLQGQGLLVANEISASRAKILRENIERWGIGNALVISERPQKLASQFERFFDRILVDAPCSGEGMFRKNPEAIKYWSLDYIQVCQQRQKGILTSAVQMLKPGGKLIYSTCTFAPEEDEQIVAWLTQNFDFKVKPLACGEDVEAEPGHPEWANNDPQLKNTLRFCPFDNLGEGQFVAKLELGSTTMSAHHSLKAKAPKRRMPREKGRLSKAELALIEPVLVLFNLPAGLENWRSSCRVSQQHVFVPALDLANYQLKVLSNGLELGMLKKNRFEPGHQLAMFLGQTTQERVVELSEEEYFCYLHGETLKKPLDPPGFVLVSCRGLIFSFGKVTPNGILKNFYPKGLRILKKEIK